MCLCSCSPCLILLHTSSLPSGIFCIVNFTIFLFELAYNYLAIQAANWSEHQIHQVTSICQMVPFRRKKSYFTADMTDISLKSTPLFSPYSALSNEPNSTPLASIWAELALSILQLRAVSVS